MVGNRNQKSETKYVTRASVNITDKAEERKLANSNFKYIHKSACSVNMHAMRMILLAQCIRKPLVRLPLTAVSVTVTA